LLSQSTFSQALHLIVLPSHPAYPLSVPFFKMPLSKHFQFPGPGPKDLASSDWEAAGYLALKQKILADQEAKRQTRRKQFIDMGLPESAVKG
jgi:hypothetical protein